MKAINVAARVNSLGRVVTTWTLCVVVSMIATSCHHQLPIPVPVTFQEVQADFGRGGRTVAITMSPTDSQLVIAASEGGGLFRSTDLGKSWKHIDTFSPFRVQDVSFALPISLNPQVVIATAQKDAHTDGQWNHGGIWLSSDAGSTWMHVPNPGGCSAFNDAHGIAFEGRNWIFVAADCGLLASPNLGATWTNLTPFSVRSVATKSAGNSILIDVCQPGAGHRRSTDGGVHWSPAHTGPSCDVPHSLAVSPLENDVIFATQGATLLESDDAGQTWTDLHASAFNERPVWVGTQMNRAGHFNLFFPGRRATCAGSGPGLRCPDGTKWAQVPSTPLNHDINAIAFDPNVACPMYMAADYGVYLRGAPTATQLCGNDADWTDVGSYKNGLHALQIYQVSGAVHQPFQAPGGVNVKGFTDLFVGTQDSFVYATHDIDQPNWKGIGIEGAYLQAPSVLPISPQQGDEHVEFIDFGARPAAAMRSIWNRTTGDWPADAAWTSADPPGNGTAPILVGPQNYVQWKGTTLFVTTDNGVTWSTLANLPLDPIDPAQQLGLERFSSGQITQTSGGPALYVYIADAGGRIGLALLANLSPARSPRQLEIRTFGGRNGLGQNSGLQTIGGNCFAPGAWYCQPVYAVDPANHNNLIAADPNGHGMMISHDAGATWSFLSVLTDIVTMDGTLGFMDAIGGCQAHVIAFDPGQPAHILVGTDQAGIIASADGGATWSPLLGTTPATAITSIFFDDRTGAIYVATYGRGLWKLTLNWGLVGK